jgi:TRAP-type C4-dicarboxylate transport system substrate-binding protein
MGSIKGALAVVVSLAIGIGAATSTAFGRDLIYGSWVSAKHGLNVFAIPQFMESVAKDTNGAVTWKLLPGGSLVSGNTTLSGIRNGVVDAGLIIPSYTAKELSGNSLVMGVQVFGEDTLAASAAAVETVMLNCPECLEDFKKQNAVYLAGHAASPFYVMCRSPVEKLADLKGKKVRSSGSGSRMVAALGGVPTPMSPAEGVTAMQRGAIDCVFGSIAWLQSYSYQDVVTHVLNIPLGIVGALGTYTVNRKTWDGFTPEQKKVHFEHLPMLASRAIIKAYVEEDIRVEKEAKAKGIKFVKADPKEFNDVIKQFSASEEKVLVSTAQKFGVKNPEQVLASFDKNLKKWQSLTPAIGLDVDKYAAAIKREIYDKLDPTKF